MIQPTKKQRPVLAAAVSTQNKTARDVAIVIRIAEQYWGHPAGAMTGGSRTEPLATHRQVAMVLAHRLVIQNTNRIAEAFQRESHGTISHALRIVPSKLSKNQFLLNDIKKVKRQIEAGIQNHQ